MASATRQRIAGAATEHGWELSKQTSGSDTYVRDGWRLFVEYTGRGGVNYASLSPRGALRAGARFRGTGKADQVVAALADPEKA